MAPSSRCLFMHRSIYTFSQQTGAQRQLCAENQTARDTVEATPRPVRGHGTKQVSLMQVRVLGRKGDQAGTLHEHRGSVRGPSIPVTCAWLVTGGWLTRLGTPGSLRTLVPTVLEAPTPSCEGWRLGWVSSSVHPPVDLVAGIKPTPRNLQTRAFCWR